MLKTWEVATGRSRGALAAPAQFSFCAAAISVDDAMLTAEFPIFLDGFDGNDAGENMPCRWGS